MVTDQKMSGLFEALLKTCNPSCRTVTLFQCIRLKQALEISELASSVGFSKVP